MNLSTSFLAVKYGAKALSGRGGAVVLISTAAAQIGLANHEAIAAAKAGVIGLVRSAAATYSPVAFGSTASRRDWSAPRSPS